MLEAKLKVRMNQDQIRSSHFVCLPVALLEFGQLYGVDYVSRREDGDVDEQFPFSSNMKRMSIVVNKQFQLGSISPKTFHTKGAAEVVLAMCTRYLSAGGEVLELDDAKRKEFTDLLATMSSKALRSICLATRGTSDGKDLTLEDSPDLICIGLVGIQDPLRPEIRDAVRKCKAAGVVVRMVTGDATAIARSIASGCGIFEVCFVVPLSLYTLSHDTIGIRRAYLP